MSTGTRHDDAGAANEPAPLDATQILRDEELLDSLIRGVAPPADDELAGLLSAWRTDLDQDLPEYAIDGSVDGSRRRRRLRLLVLVAVAVVGIGGGATAAAAQAGPDSPLWPLAKVAFPHRADSRAAEQQARTAIEQSRQAIAERRFADAEKLLVEAARDTGRIEDPGVVDQLRAEIAAVRGLLPGAPGGGGPVPGPSATATPSATGHAPTPAPTASGGTLPLPVPLPTISLPRLPTL